jgi:drug/metabolite transporter (DMT)-like permease
VFACLGAVWVLFGSAYLAIRLIINDVAPFQAMAQRFLGAGAILVAVVVLRRGPGALRVTRRQLLSLVVTGVLLMGLGNGLQALAQVEGLPSGVAALLLACVPVWAVLVRSATGDRPSAVTWLGVAVGFAGLVVLVAVGRGTGGAIPLVGVLLCVGAGLAWTVGGYLQGFLPLPGDVVTVAAYQQLVAAGCSATLAAATGERFSVDYSPRGWFALVYLVVACSVVGFLAFAWLLRHASLSLTATHAYVNPVVAVLLGWAVLAEPIGLPVLLGGGVVVGAVVLIVMAERPRAGTVDSLPSDLAVSRPGVGEVPDADVTRFTPRR